MPDLEDPLRPDPKSEDGGEVVTLVDEEGVPRPFRLHDAFDLEGSVYYLVEALEGAPLVLILEEGPDGLESVTGEKFDRVMALLEADEP